MEEGIHDCSRTKGVRTNQADKACEAYHSSLMLSARDINNKLLVTYSAVLSGSGGVNVLEFSTSLYIRNAFGALLSLSFCV